MYTYGFVWSSFLDQKAICGIEVFDQMSQPNFDQG